MSEETCRGCIWYREFYPKIRCFNITMIDRGGWHPLPPGRCEEYKQDEPKEITDTDSSRELPEDKGQQVHRRAVQQRGKAGDVHPDQKRTKVSGSGRRKGSGN